MDPILKQRLVGATVLTALAVIFVPMLFDESGNAPDVSDFEIPEIPDRIARNPVEPPTHIEDIEPKSASLSTSDSTPEIAPREILDERKKEPLKAWVIQLGSFGRMENAQQLRDRLRSAGFPAYVERVKQNGKVLFRVRVGPELDPARARNQRDDIARKLEVKGIVMPGP